MWFRWDWNYNSTFSDSAIFELYYLGINHLGFYHPWIQLSSIQPTLNQPSCIQPSWIQPSWIQPSLNSTIFEFSHLGFNHLWIQPSWIQPSWIQPSWFQPFEFNHFGFQDWIQPSLNSAILDSTIFDFSHIGFQDWIQPSWIQPSFVTSERHWMLWYLFQSKQMKARDCYDLYQAGFNTSGVYQIFPDPSQTNGTNVYCDMTTQGGGWTVSDPWLTLTSLILTGLMAE